ncbi:MAG: hypothetical protein LAP21_12960 [Acidobacteriia bacterium]|nr:hypothetical protein [Terriglobia bacterium]
MACCGKKRAAERLARGQSQPPAKPAPLSPPPPAPIVRPVRPAPPAPVSVTTPRYPVAMGPAAATQTVAPPDNHPPDPPTADIEFEYTGNGRLTVTGPITGTVYYFTAGGESVTVHGSDASSLESVPGLKIAP